MKLAMYRKFKVLGQPKTFTSITHYCANDPLADKLAKAVRRELPYAYARVVQDATGFRHVFVDVYAAPEARIIAERREFS